MELSDRARVHPHDFVEEDDPFEKCVAPSDIATEDQQTAAGYLADPGFYQNQGQLQEQTKASPMMVLDPTINLQVAFDVRKLLNRKPQSRPKPLLRLVCRGCGLSTHDEDPLLPQDYVEFLAYDLRRCVSEG